MRILKFLNIFCQIRVSFQGRHGKTFAFYDVTCENTNLCFTAERHRFNKNYLYHVTNRYYALILRQSCSYDLNSPLKGVSKNQRVPDKKVFTQSTSLTNDQNRTFHAYSTYQN